MSKEPDLTKLKELLRLQQQLARAEPADTTRYNALVDWARRTYWHVGVRECGLQSELLVEPFEQHRTRAFTLAPGTYTFSALHFGTALLYAGGQLLELGSGAARGAPEELHARCRAMLARYADVEALRFCNFRERYVLEQVHARARPAPHVWLPLAAAEGLSVAQHTRVRVERDTEFSEEYFGVLVRYLRARDAALHVEAVCCVRDGRAERWRIAFGRPVYCCVDRLELEQVGPNRFLPCLITFAGDRVLARDLEHLVQAHVRVGAFIVMRKLRTATVLVAAAEASTETRATALRRIMQALGGEYFANGAYVSRLAQVSVEQLADRMGVSLPCATPAKLCAALREDAKLRERVLRTSDFDMACEYLSYQRADVVAVINSMKFKIEQRKIVSFELESAGCLRDDPTLETIYSHFCQFVAVFNFLAEVRLALECDASGVKELPGGEARNAAESAVAGHGPDAEPREETEPESEESSAEK
ncbi:TPA_asm: MC126R [Molluscum contagiosum virus]|uniref:MC126R n=2 Tax=Molluscum contagiosum virus TaxID=10279 RepID=A0A7G5AXC7_MCV1|nr:MC126 [Molluscum contagiosum virus subtype 1]AZT86228.1 MC126R [Molluscum contagiosum virus]AQY17054.1 MC126 [Molluscum contagiosum virus subtype 1]AQY17233.1 MC126 [Molluscum contagiosum virus subtype 1]AYO87586.1 MC126 [Molluscum contagiosum virus subtype 1]